MRFSNEAYDKLFPKEVKAPVTIETPVETFTPTKTIIEEGKSVTDVNVDMDEIAAPDAEGVEDGNN